MTDVAHTYVCLLRGINVSGLSNNFLERRLATVATTRNWKTVNALREILSTR